MALHRCATISTFPRKEMESFWSWSHSAGVKSDRQRRVSNACEASLPKSVGAAAPADIEAVVPSEWGCVEDGAGAAAEARSDGGG